MKRKLLAMVTALGVLVCVTVSGSQTMAKTIDEQDVASASQPKTTTKTVTATKSSDDFSLMDLKASQVDTGMYATDEAGDIELVLTLFKLNDKNKTPMVSLCIYSNSDGSSDVICGQYTATTEKDKDNIDWTELSFKDVYTGEAMTIGCAETDDGECYIYDSEGTLYTGEYLTPQDTITYMDAFIEIVSE